MKCPYCGRENPDIRLFCMQCGELLPEADNSNEAAPVNAEDMQAYERPADASVTENVDTEPVFYEEPIAQEYADEAFAVTPEQQEADYSDDTQFYRSRQRARGIVEEAWPEDEPAAQTPASIFDEPYEALKPEENLYSRPAYDDAPRRPVLDRKNPAPGRARTIIPKRDETMDPDDFFAVRGQVLPEYDDEPEERPRRRSREGDYEDGVHQSFAVRHMRGVVTLLLLGITVAIVLIWANTDSAQYTLAKVDIAWKASAYAELADEAYAAKALSAAGYYYTAALKRDESNYNYAIMAANSYIEGGYTSKALEALRTCIGINPSNADLYAMLLQLQPDMAEVSEADRQLINTGYELTGDSRLNIE